MTIPLTTIPSDDTLTQMDPRKLAFLGAVYRIDKLRAVSHGPEIASLISKADDVISSVTDGFGSDGSTQLGSIINLVKFAGYLDEYEKTGDRGNIALAAAELEADGVASMAA